MGDPSAPSIPLPVCAKKLLRPQTKSVGPTFLKKYASGKFKDSMLGFFGNNPMKVRRRFSPDQLMGKNNHGATVLGTSGVYADSKSFLEYIEANVKLFEL